MDHIFVMGQRLQVPAGFSFTTNHIDDHEAHFKHRPRRKPLQHIVIHETAGVSKDGCVRTLRRKGSGVHLIVDRDGSISQHGDLVFDRMVHANQLNETSVGIEFVNPYAPHIAKKAPYAVDLTPRKWWTWTPDKSQPFYVLPTANQLDTARVLIPWLCKVLDVPYVFPTWYLNQRQRKIDGWRLKRKPPAGVVAHRDFATHADGRYILERLILDKLLATSGASNRSL
jgi:hypothetical protein